LLHVLLNGFDIMSELSLFQSLVLERTRSIWIRFKAAIYPLTPTTSSKGCCSLSSYLPHTYVERLELMLFEVRHLRGVCTYLVKGSWV